MIRAPIVQKLCQVCAGPSGRRGGPLDFETVLRFALPPPLFSGVLVLLTLTYMRFVQLLKRHFEQLEQLDDLLVIRPDTQSR